MSSAKVFSKADSLFLSNLFSNKDDVSLNWRPITQLYIEYYGAVGAMVNSRGVGTHIKSDRERKHIVSIIKDINKHGIPRNIKRSY